MVHGLARTLAGAAVVLGLGLATVAVAQTAPQPVTQGASDIKRTILQRIDVPGSTYETVIALVEIVPNGIIGRHTHFGVDSGVIQSGGVTLNATGLPEQVVAPGGSWQIPANTVHWGKAGPDGAKIVNTYVVEKGKPLATPAP